MNTLVIYGDKNEEFNKILNSLPLDKILMNKIIKALFE